MKEYYVIFSEHMSLVNYMDLITYIARSVFDSNTTHQSARQRELPNLHRHYHTLQAMHELDFGRAFKFTEEEIDLMYMPFSTQIAGYYDVDEVEELTLHIQNAVNDFMQRA